MDTASESLPQPEKNEIPHKGEVFRVMDTPETRGADGLVLHNIDEKDGILSGGANYLEDVIVRMPVGTKVTVEQVFKDEKGVWVVFDYTYHNKNRGDTYTLRACAMVEKFSGFTRTPYMEKVTETASALEELRMEIQGSEQA